MHSQHNSVLLTNSQHLFANDKSGECLRDILDHLPAVDTGAAHAGLVRIFGAALLVLSLLQLVVPDQQPIGQLDTGGIGIHTQNPILAERHRVATHHVAQHGAGLLPHVRDHVVGFAVDADDLSRFGLGDVHPRVLERQLELLPTHAVARTQHRGLTHEPLVFGHVTLVHVIDCGSHLLVDVALRREGLHHVVLPSQPRKHTRFDLCRVGLDDAEPFWRHDALLKRLGVRPPTREVL